MEKHVVQVNIYRLINGAREYLLLKRTPQDGNFWQPITGTVDPGETLSQTIERELQEEAGIETLRTLTPELHSYTWVWQQEGKGTDHVFAAEVAADQAIVLNPDEHDQYRWLGLEEAIDTLKWPGNKASLQIVDQVLSQSTM